jgi:hypothetical protein
MVTKCGGVKVCVCVWCGVSTARVEVVEEREE